MGKARGRKSLGAMKKFNVIGEVVAYGGRVSGEKPVLASVSDYWPLGVRGIDKKGWVDRNRSVLCPLQAQGRQVSDVA